MEQGKLRLEVTLYSEAQTRETPYGPREERDRLVHLDLPVTHAAWRFIESIVTQYSQPRVLIANDGESLEDAKKRWQEEYVR